MDDSTKLGDDTSKEAQLASQGKLLGINRRKLLKLGVTAAPVVMTLASRPVLAWHCKSPSAWGSEQLNPNTSLKTNAGHSSFQNEVWTISNWRSNTARSGTGVNSKPWKYLKLRYPAIVDSTTMTNGNFDYSKVTIAKLLTSVPGLVAPGYSGTELVKDVLTGDFRTYALVGQLNLILSPPLPKSEMERCVTLDEMNKMATGTYRPPNLDVTWTSTDIRTYLYNNWIVRP